MRTLPQSLRDSSLSEGAFDWCMFFSVPQRKQEQKLKLQSRKFAHFPSAAAQCAVMRLSGRKAARASVTEGARGTERQQKAAVLPFCGFRI